MPRSRSSLVLLSTLLATTVALPLADAGATAPAPPSTVGTSRVLVELAAPALGAGPGLAARASRLEAARSDALDSVRASGGTAVRTYAGLPYVAVDASPAALARLRADDGVVAVRSDEPHRASLDVATPLVGAAGAWAVGADGTGELVAVLDSGVQAEHPFLGGRVVDEACYSQSASCPNGRSSQLGSGAAAPCTYDSSACGHGTHVAGIVAGSGTGAHGVARGASVAAVQVFSRSTSTDVCGSPEPCAVSWTSDLLAGLDHVASLARTRRVAAVNLSLGGGAFSGSCDQQQPSLKTAVDVLRGLGVLTVVAAGNESAKTTLASPACLSGVVAVGATTSTGTGVRDFSNSSSELDLLAPGSSVLSSYPGGTAWMTGTSQAAPFVAGAVAVLRDSLPAATAAQVVTALTTSGTPVLDSANGRTTPFLRVDLAVTALAVLAAAPVVPAPLDPAPLDPAPLDPLPVVPAPVLPAPVVVAPAPVVVAPVVEPAPVPAPSPVADPSPVPIGDAPPVPLPSVLAPVGTRLSGADRYATAAEVFTRSFGCPQGGAASAVLARGDAFPDALAGSYLAGAQGTGVLLTPPSSLAPAALQALRDSGARTVYLLGGTSAVSEAAAAQLAATPSVACDGTVGPRLTVVRVSGGNRYDTARATAERAGSGAVGTLVPAGGGTPLRTAVLASGLGFADALAAGPLSYSGAVDLARGDGRGFPTLLTSPASLAPEAEAALRALGVQQVLVPGGTAVVSPAVVSRLQALGLQVVRLAGSDRSATAARVARFAVEALGFPATGVALARGDAFADALAGASFAGDAQLPLLLTAGAGALGDATLAYLHDAAGRATSLTAFGGAGAISPAVLTAALAALTA